MEKDWYGHRDCAAVWSYRGHDIVCWSKRVDFPIKESDGFKYVGRVKTTTRERLYPQYDYGWQTSDYKVNIMRKEKGIFGGRYVSPDERKAANKYVGKNFVVFPIRSRRSGKPMLVLNADISNDFDEEHSDVFGALYVSLESIREEYNTTKIGNWEVNRLAKEARDLTEKLNAWYRDEVYEAKIHPDTRLEFMMKMLNPELLEWWKSGLNDPDNPYICYGLTTENFLKVKSRWEEFLNFKANIIEKEINKEIDAKDIELMKYRIMLTMAKGVRDE